MILTGGTISKASTLNNWQEIKTNQPHTFTRRYEIYSRELAKVSSDGRCYVPQTEINRGIEPYGPDFYRQTAPREKLLKKNGRKNLVRKK